MDSNLKRTIMLENYQNPTNKGLIDDDSTSRNLKNAKRNLDSLIDQFSKMKNI